MVSITHAGSTVFAIEALLAWPSKGIEFSSTSASRAWSYTGSLSLTSAVSAIPSVQSLLPGLSEGVEGTKATAPGARKASRCSVSYGSGITGLSSVARLGSKSNVNSCSLSESDTHVARRGISRGGNMTGCLTRISRSVGLTGCLTGISRSVGLTGWLTGISEGMTGCLTGVSWRVAHRGGGISRCKTNRGSGSITSRRWKETSSVARGAIATIYFFPPGSSKSVELSGTSASVASNGVVGNFRPVAVTAILSVDSFISGPSESVKGTLALAFLARRSSGGSMGGCRAHVDVNLGLRGCSNGGSWALRESVELEPVGPTVFV